MKAIDFWNKAAKDYDASAQSRYARAYERTIAITKEYLKNEDRVLDFACGTGIVTNEIAPLVQSVTAIDISEEMVALARKKTAERRLENITYLVTGLNDPRVAAGRYTTITAFNVMYFIEDLDELLKSFHEMLPAGGLFLSVTDCPGESRGLKIQGMAILSKLGLLPYFRSLTTAELTGKIEKAGFELVRVENLHPDPPNVYVAARKPGN